MDAEEKELFENFRPRPRFRGRGPKPGHVKGGRFENLSPRGREVLIDYARDLARRHPELVTHGKITIGAGLIALRLQHERLLWCRVALTRIRFLAALVNHLERTVPRELKDKALRAYLTPLIADLGEDDVNEISRLLTHRRRQTFDRPKPSEIARLIVCGRLRKRSLHPDSEKDWSSAERWAIYPERTHRRAVDQGMLPPLPAIRI
jgi:hypothetical protein